MTVEVQGADGSEDAAQGAPSWMNSAGELAAVTPWRLCNKSEKAATADAAHEDASRLSQRKHDAIATFTRWSSMPNALLNSKDGHIPRRPAAWAYRPMMEAGRRLRHGPLSNCTTLH